MIATVYFKNGEHIKIKDSSSINGEFYDEIKNSNSFAEFVSTLLTHSDKHLITVVTKSKDDMGDKKHTYMFVSSSISHIICRD